MPIFQVLSLKFGTVELPFSVFYSTCMYGVPFYKGYGQKPCGTTYLLGNIKPPFEKNMKKPSFWLHGGLETLPSHPFSRQKHFNQAANERRLFVQRGRRCSCPTPRSFAPPSCLLTELIILQFSETQLLVLRNYSHFHISYAVMF